MTVTLHVHLATIPVALKARPQWVAWRLELRQGKRTKVPYAVNGEHAKVNDPSTWTSFDEVVAYCRDEGRAHLGFVITRQDPFTVCDLDHVRDPQTGLVDAWAREIVEALDSYTEVSPSGSGLHIWLTAMLSADGRRTGRIELYHDRRFLTMTGTHLEATPRTIEPRQVELKHFLFNLA